MNTDQLIPVLCVDPTSQWHVCMCTQYRSIIVDNCKIKYKSYNYIYENNETIHSMQTMCKCYLDQVRFLNQIHAIIYNRHYTGLQKRHQHNKMLMYKLSVSTQNNDIQILVY